MDINELPQYIKRNVNEVLLDLLGKYADEFSGKKGGYYFILNRHGTPLIQSDVGELADKELQLCLDLALQRGKDIARNAGQDPNKYGNGYSMDGAVIADTIILSFAGVNESADEAICLAVAVRMKWISLGQASRLAHRRHNPYWNNLSKEIA